MGNKEKYDSYLEYFCDERVIFESMTTNYTDFYVVEKMNFRKTNQKNKSELSLKIKFSKYPIMKKKIEEGCFLSVFSENILLSKSENNKNEILKIGEKKLVHHSIIKSSNIDFSASMCDTPISISSIIDIDDKQEVLKLTLLVENKQKNKIFEFYFCICVELESNKLIRERLKPIMDKFYDKVDKSCSFFEKKYLSVIHGN